MSRKKLKIEEAALMSAIAVNVILFVKDVWQTGTQENAQVYIDSGAALMMKIDEVVDQLDRAVEAHA